MLVVTDLLTWLLDNEGRIFRFLVHRRIYTPYEQQKAFIDETRYEDSHYSFGLIKEAVDLGNGEWLIGIQIIIDDELTDNIEFYRLSELKLEVFETDQNMFRDEGDDDE